MQQSGYSPKLVREYNELNILRCIKQYGPISRAGIAKRFKISKAAVSEIVLDLLNVGFVFETGIGESTRMGGRRPIMLEFNHESGYAIGVEIKRNSASVALGDLNAQLRSKYRIDFETGTNLNQVLQMIFEKIHILQQEPWIRSSRPIGIGVAIPGLINYERGMVVESDSLKGWQNVSIKQIFENEFKLETLIENDVKSSALAELHFGNARHAQNVIYMWIADGIGAGLVINGQLYRGISASAGEVGFLGAYSILQNDAEFPLLFQKQKHLGDLFSLQSLNRAIYKAIDRGQQTRINPDEISYDRIGEFVAAQDPVALSIMEEYGAIIGTLAVNMINTLNPELIILSGNQFARSDAVIKVVGERINQDDLWTPAHAVQIRHSAFREDSGLLGSIALIFEDLFFNRQADVRKYRDIFRKN
jgi:glucokinase